MGLKIYRSKRNFMRTPEPEGRVHGGGEQRLYVIQKHAATRLHYDLRLEEGGVLKSWAVPKGPSLDPKERRLAVQVEDHPLEYGGFEGVIPKGQYGGGRVQLWDRGHWVPEGDAAAGLRKGKLKFHLEGEKLRGVWNLVRMHGQTDETGKTNWLLIKEHDEAAQDQRDIVQERPESILSGRRIEDMESSDESVWHSNRGEAVSSPSALTSSSASLDPSHIEGARKTALPDSMPFQLATLTDRSPVGGEWLHEIKLDGFRMQCRVEKGKGQLLTRTGQDWTHRFPGVAQAAAQLPVQTALFDGELVALQPDGRSSFQLLQRALSEGADATLVYYAFDLLYLDGYDVSLAPLETRKDTLKHLLEAMPQDGPLRYSDHVVGGGQAFYEAACRLGLEGMIAKRKGAPYRGGRGGDWLKVKCLQRQEFVIGGFTDPSGSRTGFGALLIGVYEDDRLIYAGRVGTGFSTGLLKTLAARLQQLRQTRTPFHTRVPGPLRNVHWVRPELVAEIAFTEWTSDHVLRHPSFQGLREDKKPIDVRREIAQPPPTPNQSMRATEAPKRRPARSGEREVEIAGIHLTHPTRVLYPQQGLTKRDLAAYYESIADRILPHIVKRPMMLLRCPEGHEKECFHQKHTNRMVPGAVHSIEIKEGTGKASPYLMVDDLPGLIALVQMGALELHVWGSHAGRIEYPDRMVFDLDPDEGLPWPRVVEAAELVRDRLTELGLQSWVKTTGGKGLHVVVPLTGKQTWDEVKGFSQALAERLVKEKPDRYTSKMSKAGRKGKVFLDYLRNSRGATAVAAYSTRARAGATVSTPVRWDELPHLMPDQFTVKTVLSRFKTMKDDPWKEFWNARQSITQSARRAVGLK
ncbi:MAG TPA: DNA ligase D [Nitrospiraceae bacterium]|nr:DNA ligase D [Nitrospiraceae bacterium]